MSSHALVTQPLPTRESAIPAVFVSAILSDYLRDVFPRLLRAARAARFWIALIPLWGQEGYAGAIGRLHAGIACHNPHSDRAAAGQPGGRAALRDPFGANDAHFRCHSWGNAAFAA